MNEQRRQILQMLADGKITADDAEQLIAALDRDQPDTCRHRQSHVRSLDRSLRVVVNSPDNICGLYTPARIGAMT